MSRKLTFLAGNGLFMLIVDGKNIYYNDKLVGVQMLYPTPSKKAIQVGGAPTKKEKEEYESYETEEDLVAFCIKDAKKAGAGARLIKTD